MDGNKYLVGINGDDIVVMRPPMRMTPDEAIEFSAWLVCLANGRNKFMSVLDKVEGS